jgi:integrase
MRVYMNPNDYETMIESAESRRAEIAMRCMGRMGLRVSETNFKMEDIRESTDPDVDILFLTIYGKDTTGRSDDGKRRDVWVPRDLYERLRTYVETENRSDHHPILPVTKKTIQNDVNASADNAALRTGNTDFEEVTCHDFRAYFATNMLLREGVDIEVVMEIGGWADRQSMDPYLNASFDDIIQGGLAEAGVLSDDIDTELSDTQLILKEIQDIKAAFNEIDSSLIDTQTAPDQAGLLDF